MSARKWCYTFLTSDTWVQRRIFWMSDEKDVQMCKTTVLEENSVMSMLFVLHFHNTHCFKAALPKFMLFMIPKMARSHQDECWSWKFSACDLCVQISVERTAYGWNENIFLICKSFWIKPSAK